MALPVGPSPGTTGGPSGYTYGAVAVALDEGVDAGPPGARSDVLTALRAIRFSGWVGPAAGGWVLAVPAEAAGAVAAARRGLVEVGALLAQELGARVVAVRVLRDRQLVLAVWNGREEVGRYVSDPAYGLDDKDVLPLPLGAEHAEAFATALGVPQVAAPLEDLLSEELDPESTIESERLAEVLRLLELPRWLVASGSLPRDVPGGPRSRDLTRLRAGLGGVPGRLLGPVTHVVRRRRPPPPVLADPPRAAPGLDPWLF
jgi:hypothetical protein